MATAYTNSESSGMDRRYRVPLDDRVAWLRIRRAERNGRFVEIKSRAKHAGFGYSIVKTHDGEGHIDGLAKYEKSDRWEKPFRPGRYEGLEIRNARHGGTQVKGTVTEYPGPGYPVRVLVNFTVDATPTEIKDDPSLISEPLHWELEDWARESDENGRL